MEELSHAFDGGIYGELIQNRSFEEGVLPPGMKLVKKPDGGLKMELEKLPPGVPKEKWDMPWPWFMNCGWDPQLRLDRLVASKRGRNKGRDEANGSQPDERGIVAIAGDNSFRRESWMGGPGQQWLLGDQHQVGDRI